MPTTFGGQGQARDKVAAAVGTNARTLERAKVVVEQGIPELVEAMDALAVLQ